ncbi:phage holin family protein [Candidatus Roizmanbacteria bacterium]|nr:phage holin family protein [Candidatus Roizmanbacteria bacterium]
MRSILRNIAFYSFALFLTSQILNGVKITGGFATYLLGGAVLFILFLIVKPILSIITFPLHIATLGIFSFFVNAIILYLLTIIVPNIAIGRFIYPGFSFAGFIIPKVSINDFFAFVTASIVLSFIVGGLKWMVDR